MNLRKLLCLATCALALAPAALAKTTDNEKKIGKEGEDEVAKQFKVVKNPVYTERVARIGADIAKAAATEEPDLVLKFTVLDVDEVNAFSLPNGAIYVNKGLIDSCESDDELAGVLAHEAAHAARHHLRQLLKKQSKVDVATIAAILVGAAAGVNVGEAAQAGQLMGLGGVNAYNQKLESEADRYGVEFMLKTHYNPVGMLTFMERLARQENWTGQGRVDYGIFRTHPMSVQRKNDLLALLNKKGISINRREVMKSLQAQAVETTVNGKLAAQIVLGGNFLWTVADDGSAKAMDRAKNIADRLNKALGVRVGFTNGATVGPDGRSLLIQGTAVYEVADADAALLGMPAATLAQRAKESLSRALYSEYVTGLLNRTS